MGTPVQRPDYKNEKQASDSLIILLLLVLGLVLGLVLLVIIITLPTPSNYKDKDGISNNGTHRPILVVIHWDKPYPVGRCYAIDTSKYILRYHESIVVLTSMFSRTVPFQASEHSVVQVPRDLGRDLHEYVY